MMVEDPVFPVTGLGESGEGAIAGADGRTRYVAGALPGDVVRMGAGGDCVVEAKAGASHRARWLCPHAPACGGCTVQHMADDTYVAWKGRKLGDALKSGGLMAADDLTVVEQMWRAPLQSRRRAVFTARGEPSSYRLGFHEHGSHALIDLKACAILTPAIVSALSALKEIAAAVSGPGDCRLTVLDTGQGLDVSVETGTQRRNAPNVAAISGGGRIMRLTVDGDPLLMKEQPYLEVASVRVRPPPGGFVQASAAAEAALAAIALDAIRKVKAKRVADLFSGLGAFTFALARTARVVAFDSDRSSIEALAAAARGATGLKPIETIVRDLHRDPLSATELAKFDAVVFDPPRAGAKGQAASLVRSKVETVVAVSCNLRTLIRDLKILVDGGYRVIRALPVDQFLFTPHLEAAVVLSRK